MSIRFLNTLKSHTTRTRRGSIRAKPSPNGKQERDPTKGLTYEE